MSCEKAVMSWPAPLLVGSCHGDDAERAVIAVGTAAGIASREAPIEVLPRLTLSMVRLRGRGRIEKLACSRDETRATAVGLETEVPDTDKAVRDDVQKESVDEIRGLERESPSCIAALSVAVAKGHGLAVEVLQTTVRQRNAVNVPSEVLEDFVSAAGLLGVDDPPPPPDRARS